MNIYQHRLDSFSRSSVTWPHKRRKQQSPEALAKAGFYFVPEITKDTVRCFLCDIELDDWKRGDTPTARHAHASPTCAWVLLNFPDDFDVLPIHPDNPDTFPKSRTMHKARLHTFTVHKYWPPKLTKKYRKQWPLPKTLADAGFFFFPTTDQVDRIMCPYCRCSLTELERSSRVLSRHKEMASNCSFLQNTEEMTKQSSPDTANTSVPEEEDGYVTATDELHNTKRMSATYSEPTIGRRKQARPSNTDTQDELSMEQELPAKRKRPAKKADTHNAMDVDIALGGDASQSTSVKDKVTSQQDSVWDIEKAYEPQPHVHLVPKTTLLTYSKKHRKRTRQQSNDELMAYRLECEAMNRVASPELGFEWEAPLQSLERIPEKEEEVPKKKDKGKGRAADCLPSVVIPSPTPLTPKKSLSLSKSRVKAKETTTCDSDSPTTVASAVDSTAIASSSSSSLMHNNASSSAYPAPSHAVAPSSATTPSGSTVNHPHHSQSGKDNGGGRPGRYSTSLKSSDRLQASYLQEILKLPVTTTAKPSNEQYVFDHILRLDNERARDTVCLPDDRDDDEHPVQEKPQEGHDTGDMPAIQVPELDLLPKDLNIASLSGAEREMTVEQYMRHLIDEEIGRVRQYGEQEITQIRSAMERVGEDVIAGQFDDLFSDHNASV
ncbi:uncharacterized protein BYT42DRAFT_586646 [Radiomyces spectabilis]|uniref:uncharacterized protein n=1 Tax=Radiomyces spectabilis TaxID=64574 RepID=UPI00221E6871|nr:uncharacterized protein BYT42DRAFT_586646 [Radiomyces spectabilis]KAI8367541.1 hypothetical protein BYT42DRAFT_586646 [Radiomyces spectabilis]